MPPATRCARACKLSSSGYQHLQAICQLHWQLVLRAVHVMIIALAAAGQMKSHLTNEPLREVHDSNCKPVCYSALICRISFTCESESCFCLTWLSRRSKTSEDRRVCAGA